MKKTLAFILMSVICCKYAYCQTNNAETSSPRQYFSLHGGITLLEAPVIFYPNIGLNYSKTFWGKGTHQLALNPQFQFITIPGIEQKFLLAANVEYKFQPKWRLEASVFAGINYQLRRFEYDRYESRNGNLENIGNLRHQVGPTLGLNLGYKLFRRSTFSLSPYVGFSIMKLSKSYTGNFTEGYVPTVLFGIKLNLNK